jgi:hypothetical protein
LFYLLKKDPIGVLFPDATLDLTNFLVGVGFHASFSFALELALFFLVIFSSIVLMIDFGVSFAFVAEDERRVGVFWAEPLLANGFILVVVSGIALGVLTLSSIISFD